MVGSEDLFARTGFQTPFVKDCLQQDCATKSDSGLRQGARSSELLSCRCVRSGKFTKLNLLLATHHTLAAMPMAVSSMVPNYATND